MLLVSNNYSPYVFNIIKDDGDRSIKIFDPETGRMTQQIGPRIGFGRKLGYM